MADAAIATDESANFSALGVCKYFIFIEDSKNLQHQATGLKKRQFSKNSLMAD
jgi:hypothetical protein